MNFFRLLGLNFFHLYYFEKDLKEIKENDYIKADIELVIKKASDDNIKNIISFSNQEIKKNFEFYQKRGGVCYVAFYKNKIAGYTWVNFREASIYDMPICLLASKVAFGLGSFVFPEFRGKKVFQEMISFSQREIKKAGFEFMANFTAVNNKPAFVAREKFGVVKKRIFLFSIFNKIFWKKKFIGQGLLN